MNKNEINRKYFQELIERYLDGKTSLEEVKLLVNYYESYQQNHEWVEELGPENSINNRMLINILEAIQNDDHIVVPFYKRKVFLYTVASSIVLLLSVIIFFLMEDSSALGPSIYNNNIPIGTDKATLTLEDGAIIDLEKGQTYVADNLSSNGEALVYKEVKNPKPEIAFNYLTVPRGGQYFVNLSDGTMVWLNSESKLKYPVTFAQGEPRVVELEYGEAYFAVSPATNHGGSKFKVLSGIQEVEVLGTEFSIKAYKDEVEIYTTLVEGKVSVDNANNEIQELMPGEQSVLNKENQDIIISNVDVESETTWTKGQFSFKNESLKNIMKILSRWYDVDVIFEDKVLEEIQFKGVLSKNQNIEEILILIKQTNFIKAYEIREKTITLRN